MKRGTFRALGYDEMEFTNRSNLLPLVGIFQVLFVLLFLAGTSIVTNGRELIVVSLVVMLVSVIYLGTSLFSKDSPALLEVSYEDNRDEGGSLRLSYVTKRGKRRKNLLVKTVEEHANNPLTYMKYNLDLPVSGTQSSLSVRFSNRRLVLELGFSSATDMEAVSGILK